jgi:hypothetical protein
MKKPGTYQSVTRFIGALDLRTTVTKQSDGKFKASAQFNGAKFESTGTSARQATQNLRGKVDRATMKHEIRESR